MSDDIKQDEKNNEEVEQDEVVENENEQSETAESNASELENLQNEIEEIKDQNLRLQAEIQNMQRRSRKNREEATKYRAQNLATELIPAIDNLERVLEIETTSEEGNNIKKGVEMTLTGIDQALESQSIELLKPEIGEQFDPTVHEATAMIPPNDNQDSGVIAEVIQRGYSLNGRILRPARVIVTE